MVIFSGRLSHLFGWAGYLAFVVWLGLGWFFRDPDRIPDSDIGAVSPADGIVTEARMHCDGAVTVKIFMRLWDVHVNRAPLGGAVIKTEYIKGVFRWTWSKDSDVSERAEYAILTRDGLAHVTQIAGMLVRRIVPFKSNRDVIERGERIGIICFGSRVDVELPAGYEVVVKKGQKVYAGKTIIATPLSHVLAKKKAVEHEMSLKVVA